MVDSREEDEDPGMMNEHNAEWVSEVVERHVRKRAMSAARVSTPSGQGSPTKRTLWT